MQNTAALLFKGWIVPAHLPLPVPSTCFSPEGLSGQGHALGSPFSCAVGAAQGNSASLQGCCQLAPESEGASALPYEGEDLGCFASAMVAFERGYCRVVCARVVSDVLG